MVCRFRAGCGYHIFAGKEAARALALMSLKCEDCTDDLAGLTDSQLSTLADWERKYTEKGYPVVGKIAKQ